MADVSMNLKEFNVEFDDTNTSKDANIVSGHDIKESFATIHKRLNNIGYTVGTEYISMGSSADLNNYKIPGIYACTSNSPTITHGPDGVINFKLFVIEGQYEGSIIQYILPNEADAIYSRVGVTIDTYFSWISDWKRLGEQVILSYGNSTWDNFYNAYIHNAVVYCRASSNTNPATGSQTRMAFMAYVNNGADPTEVEFQYYRSVSSHTDSQQGDQVFVYKLNKNSGWSVTTRNAFSKINVTAPIVKSYASQQITLSHADSGVTAGTYDSVTVDAKGHVTSGEVTNLLEFTGMSQTVYDVVITVGANDVVTASGTSTSDSNSFVFGTITPPKTGHYIIKSNSTAAGTGKWYTQIRQGPGAGDTIVARVYNDPEDVELTAGTTYTCRLYFGNNIAVSDSFSVMVYPAGPADSNYVAGAPTNRRLYDTKMEYDKGRQIVNGSDLDNYLTIGTYYCGAVGDSSTGVKSLLHTPFSAEGYGFAAFKLIVEKISSDTVMQQKLIPLYRNGSFFIRRRMTINGTLGWQDWQYFNHEPTYDTSPTQNSSNPVTSDGIYNANASQQAEIDYAINTGVKNVFSGSFVNNTINTVVFTWDKNTGTVTANGTATGGEAQLTSTTFLLKAGSYIYSSAENSERTVTYDSYLYNADASSVLARDDPDDSPGNTFTISQDTNVRVNCRIASGYNAQNIVFKPMIKDSLITNDTFVPYGKTNAELTLSSENCENAVSDLYHMYYDMNVYDLDIAKLMRLNTGGTWESTFEGYNYTFNGVTYCLDTTYPIITADKARTDSYLILSYVMYCKVPYRLYGGYSPMQVQYGEYISNAQDNIGVVIPANYTGNQLKITFSENSNNTVSIVPMLFPDSYTPYSLNYPEVMPGHMFAPIGVYSNYKLSQIARYSNQLGAGQIINWATSTNHLDLNNFTNAGVYSFPTEFVNYIDNVPVAHIPFKLEVSEFYGSSMLGIRQTCDFGDTRWVRFGSIVGSQCVWDAWVLEYTIDGTTAYANITNNSTINIGSNSYTPIAFATCSTAAGTKDKVASIVGNSTWTRKIGSIVAVKYDNTNTYDANNATSGTGSITLNVNGTGAANIYYGSTANPTGTNTAAFGYANRYAYYMWDGTYWVWLSQGIDNNTTYSNMSATEIRAGTATTGRLITPANLNLANYGLGTALKADDDLNSTSVIPVTRGNRYYGSSTQICKSIKHRPDYANSSSVIFMIETKITTSVTSGSERMIMIMYARNTTTNDTNVYYRSYGGTWGSWKQVTDSTITDYVPS